jgi:hypothetical protein
MLNGDAIRFGSILPVATGSGKAQSHRGEGASPPMGISQMNHNETGHLLRFYHTPIATLLDAFVIT